MELLGGDPEHWQTNVFAHSTLYGAFSSVERVSGPSPSISQSHIYTIDWSSERIEWAIDGKTERILKRGAYHLVMHWAP